MAGGTDVLELLFEDVSVLVLRNFHVDTEPGPQVESAESIHLVSNPIGLSWASSASNSTTGNYLTRSDHGSGFPEVSGRLGSTK